MSTASAVSSGESRPSPTSRARWAVSLTAVVVVLALLETVNAVVAPGRAPRVEHWKAATDQIRQGFRPGDLIVAAPGWADPVMRMHVGDLLPIPVAARMDDARFGRIWVVSQQDGGSAEATYGKAVFETRVGPLTLRRFERRPAEVTYDFLERWQDAYVTRWDPAARKTSPCPWQGTGFTCPISGNSVRRTLVEVDNQIKRAILAPPAMGAIVAVNFPSVTLGRELVVAVGLHDNWARKIPGAVFFEIWLGGEPVEATMIGNRSGWRLTKIDTSNRDGHTVSVRFQISAPRVEARHLAFAAEARR